MLTKTKQKLLTLTIFTLSLIVSLLIFTFRDSISEFAHYGYFGLFIVSIASSASIIFPLPGAFLVVASGSVLDPFLIALIVGLGETFGEIVGFGLGKSSSELVHSESYWYKKIKQFLEKYGIGAVFIFAAIPNPLFDLVGIASGALHFPIKKFLISCFLGKMTKSFFLAQFGNVLA